MKYGRFDHTLWRAKNADTFNPMGPFIVPGLDPMDLTIAVNVIPDLKHGDVCEVVQKDIGVLRNPVVRAGA